jgi:hypothetical protein
MSCKRILVLSLVVILAFGSVSFAAVGDNWVGTYNGTFVGKDNYGSFSIAVNADGSIDGIGHSNIWRVDLLIEGTVQPDGKVEFYTVEDAEIPIVFWGQIDFMNRILGKWAHQDDSARGSFVSMMQK